DATLLAGDCDDASHSLRAWRAPCPFDRSEYALVGRLAARKYQPTTGATSLKVPRETQPISCRLTDCISYESGDCIGSISDSESTDKLPGSLPAGVGNHLLITSAPLPEEGRPPGSHDRCSQLEGRAEPQGCAGGESVEHSGPGGIGRNGL